MSIDIERVVKGLNRLAHCVNDKSIHVAIKALEQQQKAIEDRDKVINRECQWYLDLNELENTFIASCNNNGFLLYEGGLKDNNMNCCPYCGGKIVETATHKEHKLPNIEDEL